MDFCVSLLVFITIGLTNFQISSALTCCIDKEGKCETTCNKAQDGDKTLVAKSCQTWYKITKGYLSKIDRQYCGGHQCGAKINDTAGKCIEDGGFLKCCCNTDRCSVPIQQYNTTTTTTTTMPPPIQCWVKIKNEDIEKKETCPLGVHTCTRKDAYGSVTKECGKVGDWDCTESEATGETCTDTTLTVQGKTTQYMACCCKNNLCNHSFKVTSPMVLPFTAVVGTIWYFWKID